MWLGLPAFEFHAESAALPVREGHPSSFIRQCTFLDVHLGVFLAGTVR